MATSTSPSAWSSRPCSGQTTISDIAVAWLTRHGVRNQSPSTATATTTHDGDSWDKSSVHRRQVRLRSPGTVNIRLHGLLPAGLLPRVWRLPGSQAGKRRHGSQRPDLPRLLVQDRRDRVGMVETCYDVKRRPSRPDGRPWATSTFPARSGGGEPYEWGARPVAPGHRRRLVRQQHQPARERSANSSPHYGPKSRIQAKMDNIQDFYTNFYKKNPPEPNANRFSTICDQLGHGRHRHRLRPGLRPQFVHGQPGDVSLCQRLQQRRR